MGVSYWACVVWFQLEVGGRANVWSYSYMTLSDPIYGGGAFLLFVIVLTYLFSYLYNSSLMQRIISRLSYAICSKRSQTGHLCSPRSLSRDQTQRHISHVDACVGWLSHWPGASYRLHPHVEEYAVIISLRGLRALFFNRVWWSLTAHTTHKHLGLSRSCTERSIQYISLHISCDYRF